MRGEFGVESLKFFGSNLMRCSSTRCVMVRPFFSVTVVVEVLTIVGVLGVLEPSAALPVPCADDS